ncbi:MAG: cobalamin biosynthesis protein CobD [Leptolyngbya sp. SIOISBB]|nr:cobalamin biosynthesis protein CobD [Leptolyngbya sp. SIOISBB]
MPALWCNGSIAVLLLAAMIDFVVGDPWDWLHPVQVMGWSIQHYQAWVFQSISSAWGQRLAGVGLGLGLPLLSGAIAAALVMLAGQIHLALAIAIAAVILASCLAARSLRRAAAEVLTPLRQGDLITARARLGLYVGRDTEQLSEAEILRAVMETISENATDGVMAPLFYGLLGLMISPAAGAGLAIAYKALSTLDSMIGYQSPPYQDLGWFSARCEDIVTWLPCRLTVVTIALLSRRPRRVWDLCCRDAPADPSPNAGWSECAYAAALGVQLGGVNCYRGEVKHKPLLAEPLQSITMPVIEQGLQLTRWAMGSWLLGAIVISWIVAYIP